MASVYTDIKVFFNVNQYGEWGDIVVENGDFVLDDGFETAVLISLLSDAYVAAPDEKKFSESRGWWADELLAINIGSKWWLLERSNITKQTLRLMEQYAKDSLEWMINDGIAKDIKCLAEKENNTRVKFYLVIYRLNEEPYKKRFEFNWIAQMGDRN